MESRLKASTPASMSALNVDTDTPWTSSSLLNAEFSVLISLFMRDFVYTWYTHVSPDVEFKRQVHSELLRMTQEAERRLRQLPIVVHRHFQDVRLCQTKMKMLPPGSNMTLSSLFHLHQPHVAMISEESRKEYLTHVCDLLLGILLSGTGQRNLMVVPNMLREILMSVLLHAFGRLTQPDFLFVFILHILDAVDNRRKSLTAAQSPKDQRDLEMLKGRQRMRDLKQLQQTTTTHQRSQSDITTEQTDNAFQPTAEANSTTTAPISLIESDAALRPRSNATVISRSRSRSKESLMDLPMTPLSAEEVEEAQGAMTPVESDLTAWELLQTLLTELRSPTLYHDPPSPMLGAPQQPLQQQHQAALSQEKLYSKTPLDERWLAVLNEVLDLDERHPWLWMQFVFVFRPLGHVFLGRMIQRSMVRIVERLLFSEKRIAYYVRAAREALWPNGVWSSTVPVRSAEEQAQTVHDVRDRLHGLIPRWLKSLLTEETTSKGLDTVLETLQNQQLNQHLLFALLDGILAEITTDGVQGEDDVNK